jgi:cold shock CspA family protein
MRVKGKIVSWTTSSGYGFAAVDGRSDVFVHRTALPTMKDPAVGQVISFELTDTPKGPRAENVTIEDGQ